MLRYAIVSRDDTITEAFPDLLITPSGRLVCVYTECDRHAPRAFSRLACRYSDDGGQTWSSRRRVDAGDFGGQCDCARISWLDGRIALVCGAFDASGKGGFLLAYSEDEGETWSRPRHLALAGLMPDKLTRAKDGRLLLCAQRPGKEAPREEVILYESADDGQTWSQATVVASVPGLWLCEPSLMWLKDGALACVMRENSAEGYDGYKALSRDGGRTWEPAHRMPLPGLHRPTCLRLQSGGVLITYRFMQGGKGWLGAWTQNAFAALTDDESMLASNRREQWARIMPLFFDRSSRSDIGYTGAAQLPSGEIVVVTYLVDDAPKAYIKSVTFREEDMLIVTPED